MKVIVVLAVVLILLLVTLWFLYATNPSKQKAATKEVTKKSSLFDPFAFVRNWWTKKDDNSKTWTLYTALVIIAFTIVYGLDHVAGGKYASDGLFYAGAVILIALHAVIWPFFTSKTSRSTKIVIGALIIFFVSAVAFPNAAKRWVAEASTMRQAIDDGTFSSYVASKRPTKSTTRSAEFTAVQDTWTEIAIPQNVQYSISCPNGGTELTVIADEAPNGVAPYDCNDRVEAQPLNNARFYARSTNVASSKVVVTITPKS